MEEIKTDLIMKIEIVMFKYENLFKSSTDSVEEFLKQNVENIKKEFAKISTDALHSGLIKGLKSKEFINEILLINFKSVEDLKIRLSKK